MNLKGKVAVVTGAASGIGREIANTFARAGASVVIADLNGEAARAAAEEELIHAGAQALGLAMDVTSEPEVDAAIAVAVKTFGRIDILVSNAGILIVSPIEERIG